MTPAWRWLIYGLWLSSMAGYWHGCTTDRRLSALEARTK